MAEQKWTAKVRPELHPAAAELVAAYESVPGGKRFPCIAEGIAAVLEHICKADGDSVVIENGRVITFVSVTDLAHSAALLRGEQP